MKPAEWRRVAERLEGRTIVKMSGYRWKDPSGHHAAPELLLDDGTLVWFTVTETDDGSAYGVSICVSSKRAARRRKI